MTKRLKILYVSIIVVVFVALGIWYLSTTSTVTTSIAINTSTVKSSDKLINSFIFSGLNPEEDGAVDNTNYVVNLVVPTGTDLTKLIPTISVSDGATISPASDIAQDFTNPVIYTVTAEDGSTQSYTATVSTDQPTTTTLSSDKLINSFTFAGLSPEVYGSVDNTGYQVNLVVPAGTDLTTLTPTVDISDNATIYPNSGTAQDFTNPVIYTVTAQDGSIQDYTVTVTTQQTTN
ncbi:MAG: DUF5018 domain-containing protein [Candidatus Pacebacteria bacterium]|nr:DUF5018 domain-containing protein [Candidatus Paceibacterota bacterium]